MAEWQCEEGIGETRWLLIEDGEVLAARLRWPGEFSAGSVVQAQLTSKPSGARRGTAQTGSGRQILVDHLPPSITEGETIAIRIVRDAIAERGRFKHAQGRFAEEGEENAQLRAATVRRFPAGMWEDVWDAASSSSMEFPGGEILLSVTPAMTLIDIDGNLSPRELTLAAIPSIARALRLFDVGGSIGIDFPTIEAKALRKDIDGSLGEALADWPHERTAMNGFGFVQLVARLEGPSLLHRFASARVGMCARMALRRAEMAQGTGAALLLTVHPALQAKLKPDWIDDLARRTGKQVRIETSPGLALESAQAQIVDL